MKEIFEASTKWTKRLIRKLNLQSIAKVTIEKRDINSILIDCPGDRHFSFVHSWYQKHTCEAFKRNNFFCVLCYHNRQKLSEGKRPSANSPSQTTLHQRQLQLWSVCSPCYKLHTLQEDACLMTSSETTNTPCSNHTCLCIHSPYSRTLNLLIYRQ